MLTENDLHFLALWYYCAVNKLSFVVAIAGCFSHLAFLLICLQKHIHSHRYKHTHILSHTRTHRTRTLTHFITLDSYFQYITQKHKRKTRSPWHNVDDGTGQGTLSTQDSAERISEACVYVCARVCVCIFPY